MFAQHVTEIVASLNPVISNDGICYGFPNSMISQNAMSIPYVECGRVVTNFQPKKR